ncbi:MAG: HD domain-containing phosphohydrolase [Thermovirgaceae bacterium]|mgnify:FL=1|jgi:HD-GYP domain-containing protein (c-di-GMP phosphodiesterase class II)|nr:HD domain-containing protein [Synergistales bacterium]MDI9392350.1 HD domain-containing protein [Synergistota bacterium]MDY0179570.1 HD domain-containing protein [Synergistaceae bacterium]MDD3830936.1 HD domain-containing protein [Synergistales bacterium]MDD4023905.1 HD domain-containing protein [Synergistales bacterium]
MYKPFSVDYLNLLLSFSDAVDLASTRLSQHQIRTAFICWEMGKAAGLDSKDTDDLFTAALIHDIGALSPEDKIDLHRVEVYDTEKHCILGKKLLGPVPGFERIAGIVRHHHTPYPKLVPLSRKDALLAQILNLADNIERAIDRTRFILHQSDDISNLVGGLSEAILPEAIDLFLKVSVREDFWLDVVSQRIYGYLLNSGPCRHRVLDLQQVRDFSRLFRNMIDYRSHFTATHSAGVSASAVALAGFMGKSEIGCSLMEIAGDLHDLGKLAIPNSILMKPDRLTPEEYAIVKQHTYFTYSVLISIEGMQQIAEWAAFHHERLDGDGYPFHLTGKEINLGSRIMAVADILTALAEERPYRAGLPQDKVMGVIRKQVGSGALDGGVVDALEADYREIIARMLKSQHEAHEYFVKEIQPLTV